MKHEKLEHPSQTSLRAKHGDLLQDIELVASRANAARNAPPDVIDAIVEAAEVAHVRVLGEWRKSRGGNVNNAFFDPLSKRLRRIIRTFRSRERPPSAPGRWIYQIINFEELPFERLKPYFRAGHVDEAIKSGILLGLREIPGLRIYEEPTDD